MHKYRGVALVQILLIVAILSIFALYLTQTARQQVQMASWAQDRAQAEINIRSAEAQIMFALLTEERYFDPNKEKTNQLSSRWNFHGQSFKFNDTTNVIMQDQSGLINLHYLSTVHLNSLLTANGVDEQRAVQIIDHLLDWQDINTISRAYGNEAMNSEIGIRNGLIPDITEIEHIFNLTSQEKRLIYSNTGIFYVGDLNPMTASKELIASLSNNEVARQYVSERSTGQMSASRFHEITGIKNQEGLRFYPSTSLSISIHSQINEVNFNREMVVLLSPYAKNGVMPYNIYLDRS